MFSQAANARGTQNYINYGMASEFRTKVVVRLLPHSLSEDAFKEVIGEEWLQACDWFSYWKGKPRYDIIL